jgi:hypothetical protein
LRSGIDARRGSPEPRRADANAWQIFDSSDSGFRIRSTSRQAARQSPGALIALQLEDHPRWQLGIVRRLKKLNAEQTELGVEIISRNAELIMPKEIDASLSGYSVDGIDIGLKGKSFQALYLPPQQDARVTSLPSLVLPAAEFTLRRLLLLVIEGHQYQIRLAAPFERTKDWVWTPLDSVH